MSKPVQLKPAPRMQTINFARGHIRRSPAQWKERTQRTAHCEVRVSGQAQSTSNAGELEFILGAFTDLIARKFLCDVFEQVDAEAALLPTSLGHAEAEREEVFRREGFLFPQRFEHRIGAIAAKIRDQLYGGMIFVACHCVHVQFELRRSELEFIFRLEL